MLYLRTFGGLSLENGGRPIVGAAGQRGRLAILAVLASAGQRGVSRDVLLALFWPEKDTENARGALRHGLYKLRQDVGERELTLGTSELKLNPAVVSSDVQDFDAALRSGEFERAVAMYVGPLLQGIHLHDAPDFERWADQERQRRAEQFRSALEELASTAEARADFRVAVDIRKRIAASDPLSATAAVALMRALTMAGDRTAALEFANAHERAVRAELDAAPDPAVVALVHDLRNGGAHDPAPRSAASLRTKSPAPPPPVLDRPNDSMDSSGRRLAAPQEPPPVAEARKSGVALRRVWIAAAASAGAVVLVMATAVIRTGRPELFAGPESRESRKPVPSITGIAVQPFDNLSPHSPHSYFAGGLHSELLTQLSKVRGLTVIRSSAVVGGRDADARALGNRAADLGVGSLVEASVQVLGDRLRVNVRLINATTGAQIWSEGYDETIDDAFKIQSDLARRIVSAVGAVLTGDESRVLAAIPTAHPEAYRLYLQGRDYWTRGQNRSRADMQIAEESFERALALDSGFALAHVALSDIHGFNYLTRYDHSAARAALAREHAEAALRLAPDLPQAHLAMGSSYYRGAGDYPRALVELQLALNGLPNDVEVWARIGQVHRRMGNAEEALAAHLKTTQLSPLAPELFKELGVTYGWLHRFPEAVAAYDRALQLQRGRNLVAILRGAAFHNGQGEVDTLRKALASVPWQLMGDFRQYALFLLHAEGRADSMLRIAKEAPDGAYVGQTYTVPGPLYAAWAHQLRGDRIAARRSLDSAQAMLDSMLAHRPNDERLHAARGLTLAALGRRHEALGEARWLRRSVAYREDKFQGTIVALNRARILAQLGDTDEAAEEIEPLLSRPSMVSAHALRIDPLFAPVREHARIRALLAR